MPQMIFPNVTILSETSSGSTRNATLFLETSGSLTTYIFILLNESTIPEVILDGEREVG